MRIFKKREENLRLRNKRKQFYILIAIILFVSFVLSSIYAIVNQVGFIHLFKHLDTYNTAEHWLRYGEYVIARSAFVILPTVAFFFVVQWLEKGKSWRYIIISIFCSVVVIFAAGYDKYRIETLYFKVNIEHGYLLWFISLLEAIEIVLLLTFLFHNYASAFPKKESAQKDEQVSDATVTPVTDEHIRQEQVLPTNVIHAIPSIPPEPKQPTKKRTKLVYVIVGIGFVIGYVLGQKNKK